jgi:hypothetical protein
MKCAMCGRPLIKSALVAGELSFGPKCARRLKGVKPRSRKAAPEVVDKFTLPLFEEGRA